MKKSRDAWRLKAIARGSLLREALKGLAKLRAKSQQQKCTIRSLQQAIKQLRQHASLPQVESRGDLAFLAMALFLEAKISYRAVSRVLELFSSYLGIQAPCPQTVINWIVKLSLARMQQCQAYQGTRLPAQPFSNGFIWILDATIALTAGKILTVIAVDAQHFKTHTHAPSLKDVHCVGVSVAPTWTGVGVAALLKQLIAITGRPAAVLKDGGTDLAKAVDVLAAEGIPLASIADVSHVIANLLKHKYEKLPLFNTFMTACGNAAKNLKQTVLACLAPPKISTKARFMNVHALITWAQRVLAHSPPGRASAGSLLFKLRLALSVLPQCRPLIERFLADALPLQECQKILKSQGLSLATQKACQELLAALPYRSSVFTGFTQWMSEQLSVATQLGLAEVGMPISSDTIESLFGVAKHHGVGTTKDPNRIALRIPSLVGTLTKEEAQQALATISTRELHKVTDCLPSVQRQKCRILLSPGTLNELSPSGPYFSAQLTLLPGTKKREINTEDQPPIGIEQKSTEPKKLDVINKIKPHLEPLQALKGVA